MKKHAAIAALLAALMAAGAATEARAAIGDPVNIEISVDPGRQSYSATVPHGTTQITVDPRARHPSARVTVNGGDPATPVKLAVGENVITIVVVAEDGRTSKTYTVTVTRAAAQTVAGYTVPDSLVRTVRSYYEMNRNNPGGGENWFRVLIAFGAETHATLQPYTVAEAEVSVKVWSGWQPVLDALRKLEAANAPAPAVPTVSLSAAPNPVAEGSAVRVTATLSAALAGDVTVPVAVTRGTSEDGDHGTLASILIPAGAVSATASITTADDADDDDETFTVALGALPTGVSAGSASSVAVTVTDDDTTQAQVQDPPPANPHAALIAQIRGWRNDPCCVHHKPHTDRWDRALKAFGETVADGTLTAMPASEAQTYADRGWTRWVAVAQALREIEGGAQPPASGPAVTIAAGSGVTEGGSAGFTLTANPAPAQDLGVSVTVSQSGAVAEAAALGARTVTIPAGETSTAFTVATVDDTVDEADGAVAAAVGAGTGYAVGATASASVAVADNDEAAALPAIETGRAFAREGSDAAVVFTVRLDRASAQTVSVDYATADGAGSWARTAPARAGADYTAASGTLSFAAGETRKTVSVPIVDDAIDEGTEYFLFRLSNPAGATLAAGERETQGLIRNSDPLQAMWLSRFGRMVASDAVEAVTARFETPRGAPSHLTLAGQRLDLAKADDGQALADAVAGLARAFGAEEAQGDDPFGRHGHAWNDPATTPGRTVTGRELLLGTSFRAVLGQGAGSQLTSWGQGASVSGFSAAVPGLSLSGDAATGALGFDYERGPLLTGFALTHSVGDGAADDGEWRYTMGSTATTMLPYARYAVTERVSTWAMAGTGSGRLSLDLDGGVSQRYDTDLSMTLAAAGVRGELLSPEEPGGFALALKADAFWVRTESDRVTTSFGNLMGARGESSRLRAVLDGSRTFALAGGRSLAPSLELGLRHDGGDAETGTGVELGAGLGYADPSRGLDMALRVHGLAAHAEDRYSEWGVSGQLRLVPGASGRGLSASLTPSFGVDPSGSERLWALPDASTLASNGDADPSSRVDAEVGYGLPVFGGGFTGTPNVGLGLSDTARDLRMGWRLSPARGAGFELSLDATRREPAGGDDAEHGVMLTSRIRW